MDMKKAVEMLGGDYERLAQDYAQVSSVLVGMGLSDYESRAYIALVALGPASANPVADIANIPRTSAYKALRALEKKGFAIEKPGRPRSFAPEDPSVLSKQLVSRVEEAFAKLSKLKDLLSQKGVPQLIYTIMGKERVVDKIGEMLDRSEHTFVMSSPTLSEIRRRLGKRFSNAAARGVSVSIMTSPFVKAPKGVAVVRRKALIATDVISDGKTALIAAPDLSACGYTDNEALSKHLEDFLNIMSERRD
ncbi:MAG: helix-turn-helix domain-containing protein [Thermoplasmatota archaeon]|nr:TrmB family transcriptional regulator [Candidatus Thermoplasmatota archaeon]MBU1914799.1 TrmB family transcriptional regulator [Candidatus Thermoplasmatota archaeon]